MARFLEAKHGDALGVRPAVDEVCVFLRDATRLSFNDDWLLLHGPATLASLIQDMGSERRDTTGGG
ncbi:hypothetical protein [Sorangium sp. So ce1000]|uniref:hypothetical protein n=1 Tax=Sorangium sp. So ce1000 TaxID=3133325 RepID=UPI003F5FB1C6